MFSFFKRTTFIGRFLCLLVIITNLSQMPFFVDAGITQLLSYPIWGLAVIVCLFYRLRPRFGNIKGLLVLFVLFVMMYILLCAINEAYSRSQLPDVIILAFFILIIGTCFGPKVTDADLKYMYAFYIFSSLIVGFDVYKNYLEGQSFDSRTYLYDSKNSLCQILLTAWVLIIFAKFQCKNVLLKWLYILAFLFLTFEIFVLKSRASIIGMPIVIGFAVISGKVFPKIRKYSGIFVLCFILLMLNRNFFNFFVDNILLGSRDVSDLNDLSSGRSDEWIKFMDDWTNPFFGQGRCKRESLILTSLLEFGIFGGIPIIMLALYPLYYCKIKYKYYKQNVHFMILLSLASAYCLNAVFEQQAPFGPGVKCYFLWFMLGIISVRGVVKYNGGYECKKYKYVRM